MKNSHPLNSWELGSNLGSPDAASFSRTPCPVLPTGDRGALTKRPSQDLTVPERPATIALPL